MEYEGDVGSLGMTAALDWDCEIEDKVGPHHFSPNPKVNSRYVTLSLNSGHVMFVLSANDSPVFC